MPKTRRQGHSLTPREAQVLRHLRVGQSNKEIAATLGIGEQAVKALVSRLLQKFDVPNRTTLAALAERDGTDGERHAASDMLHVALARSRQLRLENKELISKMRGELRELNSVRRRVLEMKAGGGRRGRASG